MVGEAGNRAWSPRRGTERATEEMQLQGPEENPARVAASLASSAGEALPSSEEKECPVCRSPFDLEHHAPKLLECLHTFCLECLRQLHLRAAAQDHGEGGDCAEQGYRAIICPLCRHPTVLPDSLVESLPANLRLAKSSPPPPPDHLLQPEHARQRPLWEQPGAGERAACVPSTEETRPKSGSVLSLLTACCSLIFMVLLSVSVGVVYHKVSCKQSFCVAAAGVAILTFAIICFFLGCVMGCCCTRSQEQD